MRSVIEFILEPKKYLWIDVFWVWETSRAILIIFDGCKIWLPKSWICRIKYKKCHRVIANPTELGEAVCIKISEYSWARKFA
jgi:hypothetical protein